MVCTVNKAGDHEGSPHTYVTLKVTSRQYEWTSPICEAHREDLVRGHGGTRTEPPLSSFFEQFLSSSSFF